MLSANSQPEGNTSLREMVASHTLGDLRWPDFSDYEVHVKAFYEPSYRLAWTQAGAPTPQATALIEVLKEAEQKGLNPEDYDGPRWAERVVTLSPGYSRLYDLARFDLALTICTMRYASDLHVGRWNPGLYHSDFNIDPEHDHLAELLRDRLIHAADVRAELAKIEPPFPGYRRTQDALRTYLAISREDDGEQLPSLKKLVEPGQPFAGLGRLTRLLRLTGDLPSNSPVPNGYSGPLVDAVKRFQARHGLSPDGRIGRSTLVQLNTPLARRVQQLQLTLERWRWAPHSFSSPPIVVNIPEFELRALDDSYTTELEMKVVVGGAYGHQTPVFSADMKYVIFRPYWNVPRSIERTELVPKIARDRMYLAQNDYEVVNNRLEVVARGAIDDTTLKELRSGQLHIRQVPGLKNSLGLVKFIFPNEHDVYLHGTPAKQLFAQSRRDFSHGCIRIEYPEKLAAWVLRNKPEWTRERITEAMNGNKPLQVDLEKAVPVLIVYATAVVLENGEVRFFDDIYGQDRALEELAAKGYPCPRWNPTSGARARRPHE
jgi:murein L,D-transpeptidase YcbB/YkuD